MARHQFTQVLNFSPQLLHVHVHVYVNKRKTLAVRETYHILYMKGFLIFLQVRNLRLFLSIHVHDCAVLVKPGKRRRVNSRILPLLLPSSCR